MSIIEWTVGQIDPLYTFNEIPVNTKVGVIQSLCTVTVFYVPIFIAISLPTSFTKSILGTIGTVYAITIGAEFNMACRNIYMGKSFYLSI